MKSYLLMRSLGKTNTAFIPNESQNFSKTAYQKNNAVKFLSLFIVIISFTFTHQVCAQTNTWNGGGGNNWSSGGRWSLNHVPTAAEDVLVPDNKTLNVDIPAVCRSFTINSGNSNNSVVIGGTNTLTVNGDINILAPSVAGLKTISVGAGNLYCNNLIMANTALITAICSVTASVGVINVAGDVVMNGAVLKNAIMFSGAGRLNIGGDMTGGGFNCSTSTVNCNTPSTQTMSGGYTFYNLYVNKTAAANTVDFSVPVTVNNDFAITTGSASITGTIANYTVTNLIIGAAGTLINTVDYASTSKVLNVGGDWTNNGGSFTPGPGMVNFNTASANQNIQGSAATQTFNNITLNKPGRLLGVAGSTSTLNLNATMTLTAGTFVAGTAANVTIGENWTNNGGAFTPGTGTVTFNDGFVAQNINGSAASQTFNNILVNKPGQQLNVAGSTLTLILNGSMTITAGIFAAGTATAINVAGAWANNGTGFLAGSGTVTFNGGSPQTISGSTVTSFNNVVINNNNNVMLSAVDLDITGATGSLAFNNGKIITGSNKVKIGTSATINGAAAGKYVFGNLQMSIATGSPTRVFEVGDASVYAPISVVFNNVTTSGNVTAYTVGTEHPNILTSSIDESRSVNRYWSIVNNGTLLSSYTPTFNWVAGDVDAGATAASFIIGRRTSSWAYPTMGARNPTNCTTTLSSFGTYACGEGGAGVPVIATQPIDQAGCSGGSISYMAAASNRPNSTVVWEISTNGGTIFSTLIIAAPYSVVTNAAAGVITSTLTVNPTSLSLDQYSYRAVFTNSRGSATSFDGLLTINSAPTATAGAALSPICGGGSSEPLGGSVGGSATGGTWSTPTGGTFSPNANTLNATWTPPGGFTGTATLTLTTTGGACGAGSASKTQVVATSPSTFTITPSSATLCLNAIQPLTAGSITSQSSGTINLAIPNNSAIGVTSSLAIAGIPAGAVISSVSVTFNVAHTEVSDLYMNLRAPNGNILNLANRPTNGSGVNFTNTGVTSTGSLLLSSGTTPFTGNFAPDAASGVGAAGQNSNVTAYASLFGTPNGNWVLSARDAAAGNTGSITSWSITIVWSADPVTWSPITNLYTNPAATIAYTAGAAAGAVYCKLPATGTTSYTATATNGSGCTATQTTAITAGPVVTVTPDYCYGGGYIKLQASSTPAAISWLWNTGATTSSILVNLAGNYQVTATTAAGCVASTTASIAQELVVNGDFSSGNTGFTSLYNYVIPGGLNMYPEATYTVNNNPNTDHGYFFGQDHTTGTGKMLIVNGSPSLSTIWQKTIVVQPNTTYYFSAWAVSVNDAPPYAQLQFDINGSGIGTTAVLPAGPNNTSTASVWQQFYGSWTSGAGVTSATVIIKDLQTALGGNDFAIDDISFGTLSTFVNLLSGSGSDTVRTCKNVPITNIIYSVGTGATGPSVTGLPPGVSYSFNGVTLTINGTPTTLGTYNYTVTNSSCNPITKYGQILVIQDTLTLTSAAGTDAQSGCLGSAITNITYNVGTSATGATATGLPPGVTGNFSGGVFTISGTPTTASAFTYTVTTTGSCSSVSVTGTIYVRRQIVTRSSAAGTNAQTICVNTAITNITYSIGGVATGAAVSGLPAGLIGSYSGAVFTISGTPTGATGVYSYIVTTTGPCNSVTSGGTVTVNGPTVSLTSAAGTDAQNTCVNTAITNIIYNISGTATGAGISGLPAGVSGSFSLGVYSISGTPTATGVYPYTITTSGGSCGTITATGTITVPANNTIILSSAAGTDAQTRCINTAITNVTYATTGATGATFSGLPTGVSGAWAGNVVTINGTPSVAGTAIYTVTLTGGCGTITATGTITVTANNTITLSSAAGTDAQTKCINTAITNITYTTTGATGATFSGLPTGVSGTWAANVVTISGTASVAGIANYSVTLTGGCGTITATGTITVTANNTITLSSAAGTDAQTKCINSAITNLTYTTTGATGATFSGLPTGVSGVWAGNVVTISGTPSVAGIANYTVTLTGGCGTITATGTITVTANNTITLSSAAGTDAQTRCINTAITNLTYTTTGATGATFSGLPTGVSGSWAAN
ncbi:MAG: proprotein convertase P-domain-containing protein, partial [Ferruginibacter sp.]|nr:proprotein convertase P-domain-containing protein [Ferruginibacter sp.]